MARHPKSYSERSAASQRRIDRQIQRLGGDRQRMLRQLRGGKWKPFARNPANRLPPDLPSHPERYAPEPGFPGLQSLDDMRSGALDAMIQFREWLFETDAPHALKFNLSGVTERIGHMTRDQLVWTAAASPEDVRAAATRKGINPWHYH